MDSKGNVVVVGCYVRVKEPFKGSRAYSAWVLELYNYAGQVKIQDAQGRLGVVWTDWVRVEKPSGSARAAQERLRTLLGAISTRAQAGRRGI